MITFVRKNYNKYFSAKEFSSFSACPPISSLEFFCWTWPSEWSSNSGFKLLATLAYRYLKFTFMGNEQSSVQIHSLLTAQVNYNYKKRSFFHYNLLRFSLYLFFCFVPARTSLVFGATFLAVEMENHLENWTGDLGVSGMRMKGLWWKSYSWTRMGKSPFMLTRK